MEISATEMACFIYHVSQNEILAATLCPDGGLAVVIDRGIQGAPKYALTRDETEQAMARYSARAARRELAAATDKTQPATGTRASRTKKGA